MSEREQRFMSSWDHNHKMGILSYIFMWSMTAVLLSIILYFGRENLAGGMIDFDGIYAQTLIFLIVGFAASFYTWRKREKRYQDILGTS